MSDKKKPVHWLITRFFLGFVFSILLAFSIMLCFTIVLVTTMGIFACAAAVGAVPDGLGEFFGYCMVFFWQLIGDCVEDKPMGTNMEEKEKEEEDGEEKTGWFFRVLSEQANSEQSLSIKITKYVFGLLIALACLAGGGFAGYLFCSALMSGMLTLQLGLLLYLGVTVGLGFGILLMIAEIYKIVKSVQKHYVDQYLEQFNQNQNEDDPRYKQTKEKFHQMLNDDKALNEFVNKKTSKGKNATNLIRTFKDGWEAKFDEKDKLKIFALVNEYGADKAKRQINKIAKSYNLTKLKKQK